MKNKIEFNDGFVTALMLFSQHKFQASELWQYSSTGKQIYQDIRLCGATDHFFDMVIPSDLKKSTEKRLRKLIATCYTMRLKNTKDWTIADKLFKEAEDIIALIDQQYFTKKKVTIKYR